MESIALHPTAARPDYGPDLELARRCSSGDERALREVFETHEPILRKLIYRNLGNLEDAEELAATTLLRFWRSAHSYRGMSSLRGYLARIALNLCHDTGRKRRPPIVQEPPLAPPEEHP
jgi:RNA polymerase sigma-70 factor (ECF subfamily)